MKTKGSSPSSNSKARQLMLNRLLQHPQAPQWRARGEDRVEKDDLVWLNSFSRQLARSRKAWNPDAPSETVLEWVERVRAITPYHRERILPHIRLPDDWHDLPTMTREDVALHPEHMVPDDADLKRMLVYRTAGTTGHAILVPHHARAVASYQPMMEHVLRHYGIRPRFDAKSVACFLICSQRRTVTWAATLSYWKGAGFAKVNLNPSEWPSKESPQCYISELAPQFLTGDPFSYSDLLRMEVPVRPAAMFTTAVAMRPGLKRRLVEQFGCPVIDWFSLIETGPIGYACPQGDAYHILPHDIHVEVLDENERPLPPGVRGEITVTGGRNPCLPLIRYRTRDWGTLDFTPCACGDPMPRIVGLEGRTPMDFRTADGRLVNSADLSRILREFPLVQHEFKQHANLACEITIRPINGVIVDEEQIRGALQKALGNLPIELRQNPELGNELHTGKVISYQSELTVND